MSHSLYAPSLSLLTDLYQLTMAYGYWKLGRHEQGSVFHLFFRKPPFRGGYAIAAGLQSAIEYLNAFRFDRSDIEFLKSIEGNDGKPLFADEFLDYLSGVELSIDVDAIREGSLVFGHEPLLRLQGDLLQCQLLETPLLNLVNFQTLIATKASRIVSAARGEPILEFGLRRAQGADGAISASRSAFIGGCAATSNVLAGKLYGIPVKGTHAHSWVMSFDSELESFEKYAEVMPNNCVFLVDTYDTLDGVRKAIDVGKKLRARGYEMVGIRLDSGDLAYLSIEARKLLDAGGFPDAAIVASNDLDEHIIENLKTQGAKIGVWGVGTKLSTAYDQPALGGVYKLAAMQDEAGVWHPKLKLSEQAIKTSIPGKLQVRRYLDGGSMIGDMIYDETMGVDRRMTIVDPGDSTRTKSIPQHATSEDLLQPVIRGGQVVGHREPLEVIRRRAQEELGRLHPTIRRFMNPHGYPAGLDIALHEKRDQMIREARGG